VKILFICSFNSGGIVPYIEEQADSIRKQGIAVDFCLIKGKGLWGYLKNIQKLRKSIVKNNCQIVHAQYGLSGLLANFQRKVPVITTFHGSDINNSKVRILSKVTIRASAFNIFISKELAQLANARRNYSVIPCGVDISTFYPIAKSEARQKLGLTLEELIVLFSGSAQNKVKNFSLADAAVNISKNNIRLIELKGYTRNEVCLLLNSSDTALMTSYSEGSPQFIKEAMACNCPVVSTDVGDVKRLIEHTTGCFIANSDSQDISDKIELAIDFRREELFTNGRNTMLELGLDLETTASKIIEIYDKVCRDY
jgi:teichuronic acid biosynthesis glycosyltransferase TuaC